MLWGYHDVLAALDAHPFAFVVVAAGLQMLGRFIWGAIAVIVKQMEK